MQNPPVNSIVFRFTDGTEPQVILELAEAIDLYHSTVLSFFFALCGSHQNGGHNKVEELEESIREFVRRQLRILEVGEP